MKPRPNAASNEEEQRRVAVLIDADNAQPSVIEGLLAEVAKYGVASVKRIYGDFTSPQLTQWKKALLQHSISPVQQFAYTSGKNATDSSLIIDAMDLMYTQRFDGFCLVSSDSDFTRLAQRLREEGLTVYGFGERKTPDAFVQACDKFVYTEVLRADAPVVRAPAAKATRPASPEPSARPARQARKLVAGNAAAPTAAEPLDAKVPPPSFALPFELLIQALEDASDEQGWAPLGAVGNYMSKIRPDFDPRLFGFKKLSDLMRSQPRRFSVEERPSPGGHGKALFVRALP
jgi:hypothetical protein